MAGGSQTQTVNWIAFPLGGGSLDGLSWSTQAVSATDQPAVFGFEPVTGTACVLASIDTFNQRDPATVRPSGSSGSSVILHLDEDTTRDTETTHAAETVSLVTSDC